MTDPQLLTFNNWTFQWQQAQKEPGHLVILLHGWTGDENSMGVLAHHLASNNCILAPRAPYSAPEGGYSWRKIRSETWGMPSINDLRPSAESLLLFVDAWSASIKMDAKRFDLIGFSQGAAMAYIITLLYPDRVRKMAALSGFLPDGAEEILEASPVERIPVFVSHGRQDDMVPVQRARSSVKLFKEAGAEVTYCESDSGHKVSKECLHAMDKFFREG